MNTNSKKCLCAAILGIAIIMGEILSARAEPKALYTMDFGQKENIDASKWLKKQGSMSFSMQRDCI